MKIAIVGSGISGLTAAYYLSKKHDITVYEANDYIGGHTATVDVEVGGEYHSIDTGFIVFNDRTYPNFMRLLQEINVATQKTEMSFSVRNDNEKLEYNGHTLLTLFAQKKNILNPGFYHFLYEVVRFNYLAKKQYEGMGEIASNQTLGDFLDGYNFSDYFCKNYILPMGAAIWSSTILNIRQVPLFFFVRFFFNHGLLDVYNRPQWYVIKGGSKSYIEPLIKQFKNSIHLQTPVVGIKRTSAGVEVETVQGRTEFDHVVIASHSDQALAMLRDPSDDEKSVLSAIAYQANEVVLHTDTRLLPQQKTAWAAWNYSINEQTNQSTKPTLTYNMNILQGLQASHTYCVSLNSEPEVDPKLILRRFTYHHPIFTTETIKAQSRKQDIDGKNRTWFCGAYWYNGFHEDGVRSALDIVKGIEQKEASQNVAQNGDKA